jgi:hypothetical protein
MRCSLAALASEGFPQSAHSAGRHNLFVLASSGHTLPSPPARSPACPAAKKRDMISTSFAAFSRSEETPARFRRFIVSWEEILQSVWAGRVGRDFLFLQKPAKKFANFVSRWPCFHANRQAVQNTAHGIGRHRAFSAHY